MKKIIILVLFFLSFFLYQEEVLAEEDSNLSITFETGMDGKVKMYKGFPIKVTVVHKGEESFSGDLVLRFAASENSVGAKVIPIHIEPGQTRIYTTSFAGTGDFVFYGPNNEQSIFLYEGDWQKGKEVDYSGKDNLQYSFIDQQVRTVGVLSENPDRLAGMKGLMANLQFLNLNQDSFPKDAEGLDMLDYIIIDEYPISSLGEAEQKAIINWIENGGSLIAGGTPDAKNAYGNLYDSLPVKISSETVLPVAVVTANANQNIRFSDLLVFTGEFEWDLVQVAHENVPLIASTQLGKGHIIQTSFSIGDAPVTATEGYNEWFINKVLTLFTTPNQGFNQGYGNPLYWDFGEINEIFSDTLISTGELVLILVIYLIIIIPLLYFILKRMDKREHAWWLIPTISITVSLIIFVIGAKDRLFNPLMNQIGIYVAEEQSLNGMMTVSIQSNTSGSYQLVTDQNEYKPVPISRDYYTEVQNNQMAYFEEEQDQLNITFPNVEYWSVRSVSGKVSKQISGGFEEQLKLEDQSLTGTITNNFPYEFENLFIWTGMNQYDLGPIQQGETVDVNIQLTAGWLSSPVSSGYYPYSLNDLDAAVKESLQSTLANGTYQMLNDPVIAGFTKDKIVDVDMENRNAKINRTSLIAQPFAPEVHFQGEFSLFNNDFSIEMVIVEGTPYGAGLPEVDPYFNKEIMLDPGVYQFIYQMPVGIKDKDVILESLNLHMNYVANDTFTIFNSKTGDFELLNELGDSIEFTDNASDYLNKDNTIIIQVEKTDMQYPFVSIPELSMKGSTNHD